MRVTRLLSITSAFLIAASAAFADEVAIPADYHPPFTPPAGTLDGLVITIDPGHGGSSYAPGYSGSALGVNSRSVEGDLNMRVAGIVFHHLREAGARVSMTRRDDRKVVPGDSGRTEELTARTALAEQTKSHLFLALHHNAAERATADGVMILIYPTDKSGAEQPVERAFAEILREEVEKQVHHNEKFDAWISDHPLVHSSDITSACVEFGFLTNAEFDAWVAKPGAQDAEALGVYNAIVRMWTEHRAELEALRLKNFPDAKPVEAKKKAVPGDDADETFKFGHPARSSWPLDRPAQNEQEARSVISAYKYAQMTDRTSVILDATIQQRGGAWVLSGVASVPQLSTGLAGELQRALSAEVRNDIRTFPLESVGPEPFGVCAIPMAITWTEPREATSEQTQLLLGEPLFLLDKTDDDTYYRVQGIDGYAGWVRSDAVKTLTRAEFHSLMTARTARVARNAMKKTFRIPPASRLVVSDVGTTSTTVLLPAGGMAEIPNDSLHFPADPTLGRMAAETAVREYLYTPYIFGGRGPQGMDCSGLVSTCWSTVGVQLPRDAHQQELVGQLIATPWFLDALQPGDVLFFVDERGHTYHTALSLGGLRFIHESPPEVQINSLDPNDPLYAKGWHEQFLLARRPAE